MSPVRAKRGRLGTEHHQPDRILCTYRTPRTDAGSRLATPGWGAAGGLIVAAGRLRDDRMGNGARRQPKLSRFQGYVCSRAGAPASDVGRRKHFCCIFEDSSPSVALAAFTGRSIQLVVSRTALTRRRGPNERRRHDGQHRNERQRCDLPRLQPSSPSRSDCSTRPKTIRVRRRDRRR